MLDNNYFVFGISVAAGVLSTGMIVWYNLHLEDPVLAESQLHSETNYQWNIEFPKHKLLASSDLIISKHFVRSGKREVIESTIGGSSSAQSKAESRYVNKKKKPNNRTKDTESVVTASKYNDALPNPKIHQRKKKARKNANKILKTLQGSNQSVNSKRSPSELRELSTTVDPDQEITTIIEQGDRVTVAASLFEGIANYGNTCYIDTVLVSLFAGITLFDSILLEKETSALSTSVQQTISKIVQILRSGKLVKAIEIENLRKLLGFSERQHDAGEFLLSLLDTLSHNAMAHSETLYHSGLPDQSDHKVVVETLHSLAVANVSGNQVCVQFSDLLEHYLQESAIEGLQRSTIAADGQIIHVQLHAQKKIKFLPYQSFQNTKNAAHCPKRSLIFSLQRYDDYFNRINCSVKVQEIMDASTYVDSNTDKPQKSTLSLHAVICYNETSMDSGHYLAYTKVKEDWWLFDSSHRPIANKCNDSAAMHRAWKKNAYILFFELDVEL